ncbi:MAG TPA: cytochrome c3 family protein [Vicinamibacterales bacterium]|nr:cytochrome c3 family protein [Vicinamibacterales bacterium]
MRRALTAAAIAVVAAAAWLVAAPPAAMRQPIAFPHAKHAAVACAVCHRGVTTTARAGIPSATFCAKCHSALPRDIAWVQVTRIPSHVNFSHRRHVAIAHLDCASCHGEMRDRRAPMGAAPIQLTMTTCLSCHRHEGAAEDCAACHR